MKINYVLTYSIFQHFVEILFSNKLAKPIYSIEKSCFSSFFLPRINWLSQFILLKKAALAAFFFPE